MRTRTRIITATVAGVLTLTGFSAGLAAGDTGSGGASRARNEMHQQMGGNAGMGMGMGMSGQDWSSMQRMHDAIDPAVMDAMHAQMVEQLPAELRDEANAMHGSMASMHNSSSQAHRSHHPGKS